ncbi:hypothetical protein EQ500_08025 [Lactobacillus sp. XV13L]|nr:hypothetical protein [Lactobacillus sp. XV13L]
MLKKMEAKGEITRASDDQDRRVKRVYLTSAGRKEAERIDEWANKQDTSAFFNGLSATEQEELSNYLEKIANGWDDDFKEQADRFVDPSYRMWAMNRWHKWAEEHNWSADEMRAACHHARGMHHHGCRPGSESADAEGRTCPNQRMRPPRRDFWREFWDNDKEL